MGLHLHHRLLVALKNHHQGKKMAKGKKETNLSLIKEIFKRKN